MRGSIILRPIGFALRWIIGLTLIISDEMLGSNSNYKFNMNMFIAKKNNLYLLGQYKNADGGHYSWEVHLFFNQLQTAQVQIRRPDRLMHQKTYKILLTL